MKIRLKGYSFSGPWELQEWPAQTGPGIFVILIKPDPVNKPNVYSLIYVEETTDFLDCGLPWSHPLSSAWLREAKIKNNLYVAFFKMPRSSKKKRSQICELLIKKYKPICNLLKTFKK